MKITKEGIAVLLVRVFSKEIKQLTEKYKTLRISSGQFFTQYTKFGTVAGMTYMELQAALEIEMDENFRKRLRDGEPPISVIDTVPRGDYESLRVAFDRHLMLMSNLQKTVEDQRKKIEELENPEQS